MRCRALSGALQASIFRWMNSLAWLITLRSMSILTEPIGSIPRPDLLIEAIIGLQAGKSKRRNARCGVRRGPPRHDRTGLSRPGHQIISDGEQTKPSFATYPLSGLTNLAPDGVIIPFADGHTEAVTPTDGSAFSLWRCMPPAYLEAARAYTQLPIKQAVISASALSLLYPSESILGYGREEFLADLDQ